ncbi:MAG: ribose 5-phosphate isomerase [Myxococcales bacterium]|nr:ribose 5-phosphate isomerase [Myxococcales bacterium]
MDARDRAAEAAVQHVADDMIVGLGSGDTASRAIRQLAGRRITCVATSEASAQLGRQVGLDVRAPDEIDVIDLTIDGADEIDPQLRLLKGGGGAHTREKLVARRSKALIIVADRAKQVTRLGERMRLPVEVLPFARRWTFAALEELGLEPRLRAGFTTDNGNVIADCALAAGVDLDALAALVKATSGVVEHGLFLVEATLAYVGSDDGVVRLQRP